MDDGGREERSTGDLRAHQIAFGPLTGCSGFDTSLLTGDEPDICAFTRSDGQTYVSGSV